jgi:teichuronic acid biosynthesis glycosyltransferase TuaC
MKILAITPLFPTADEPYRGAAIGRTLEGLNEFSDVRAACVLYRYPPGLRPRHYRYHFSPPDTERRHGVVSSTVDFPAIPWVTRRLNGASIYRRLRRLVAEDRPDLLLSYWIHPESYAALMLGEEFGIPVVAGARGTDLRQTETNRALLRQSALVLSRSQAILCVSGDLARIARDRGAPAGRVHTILNGVDTDIFHIVPQREARERLSIPAQERVVLFVGWLSKLKGAPELLEAFAMLPGSWTLAMAGEGDLTRELHERAAAMGVASRVKLLGPLPSSEIALWMNAADMLCLPSVTEGCPNVVLEALSCGRPVVATAVGGTPELVDHDSGILIPDNEPAKIAAAIQRAMGQTWDQQLIARKHERGWRQVAKETFEVCQAAVYAGKEAPVSGQPSRSLARRRT